MSFNLFRFLALEAAVQHWLDQSGADDLWSWPPTEWEVRREFLYGRLP